MKDWCHDPFFAHYRTEQVLEQLEAEGRRLVLPLVFWIVRSDAANADGTCDLAGHPEPPSILDWHKSATSAANSTMALFGQWGIGLDYAFRIVTVPADSAFVIDSDSDACRTKMVHDSSAPEDDQRTLAKLLEAQPAMYRAGQINVYLVESGGFGDGGAGSGVSWSTPVRFIILRGTAGALAHELGHELGLGHTYSDNPSASGTAPDEAESRDSWSARPFPGGPVDRLHVCAGDADCNGIDAPPGDCCKASGASLGSLRPNARSTSPTAPSPCCATIRSTIACTSPSGTPAASSRRSSHRSRVAIRPATDADAARSSSSRRPSSPHSSASGTSASVSAGAGARRKSGPMPGSKRTPSRSGSAPASR
ncbi:MAG: hypothetical protein L0221_19690 [Chloroflexi bacterium]|nr:hypothetical protein [Chloroflexota bacterium]